MISIQTRAYVGPDGTLTLEVPPPFRDMAVEVVLALAPLPAPAPVSTELGWPPGFFEATFGSLKDDPMEREPQGEYEVREELE